MSGKWQRSDWQAPRLFDPYYDWSVATDFRYYGKADWLPVLLELDEKRKTVVPFAEAVYSMRGQEWAAWLRISPLYRTQPARLQKPTRFLTAFAKREFIKLMYQGDAPSDGVRRFLLGRSVRFVDKQNARFAEKASNVNLGRSAVIIGVIDDDIAFAHERFRDGATSTRIHYFWDQMEPLGPSTAPYGREIVKHDVGGVPGIDSRLAAYRHGALVDEDSFYRSYGYLDFSNPGHKALIRRFAHGTHVMDLAANPPQQGIGPLLAVQLPGATTQDTSGGTLAPQVCDALWYMLHRADDIASSSGLRPLPLVVNLSYGMHAGPHDTTGVLEQAVDEITDSVNTGQAKPLLRVVLPSGNSYLSRGHAQFDLKRNAAEVLQWRVLPDDWTESFLEIWYPAVDDSGNSNSVLQVSVASPTGTATVAFGEGVRYEWQPTAGVTAALVSFYPALAGSNYKLIRISLAPTAWPDGALTLAPAGVWQISVKNAGSGLVSGINAWIQRDDTPYGYPRRGRQSYFDHADYARFDLGGRAIETDNASMVKRAGTLNAIATGKRTVVVGGFRRSDWKQAPYSASGPAQPPKRGAPYPDGPEVMAVCDDTPSHPGTLGAGSRSGSCGAMHGTSVAAPQIARWIAGDLLRPAGQGNRQDVANAAVGPATPPIEYNEANKPAAPQPKAPVVRSGAGRIDMRSTRRRRFDR